MALKIFLFCALSLAANQGNLEKRLSSKLDCSIYACDKGCKSKTSCGDCCLSLFPVTSKGDRPWTIEQVPATERSKTRMPSGASLNECVACCEASCK